MGKPRESEDPTPDSFKIVCVFIGSNEGGLKEIEIDV